MNNTILSNSEFRLFIKNKEIANKLKTLRPQNPINMSIMDELDIDAIEELIPAHCDFIDIDDVSDMDAIIVLINITTEKVYSIASIQFTRSSVYIDGLCGNSLKGAGSLMIDFIVHMCKFLNIKMITLSSVPEAIVFYKNRGFMRDENNNQKNNLILNVNSYKSYRGGNKSKRRKSTRKKR